MPPAAAPEIRRATAGAIADAAAILRAGGLVAFPTETVYGLGADATSATAVAAAFAAKGRPDFNPLIIHVTDAAAAQRLVIFDRRAAALAGRFWPGALTLVLPRRPDCPVSLLAGAGLDTLAVRAPDHAVAQALLAACGRPLAAPSANRSGAVSPTNAGHVAASLGGAVDMVLDGGPCPLGIESTVLDLSGATPCVLRPGGVPAEDIAPFSGPLGGAGAPSQPPASPAAPASPGMLERHYATRIPLRTDADAVRADEALLSFGAHHITGFAAEMNLSPSGDLAEAAANLFAMMRRLDRPEFAAIAAMPVPEVGLGRAINDRLRRAAHPAPLARDGAMG